ALLARIEHAVAARRRRAGYAVLARRAVGRAVAGTERCAAELRRRARDERGARATAAVRRVGARSAGARAAGADGIADDRARVGGVEDRGRTAGDAGVVRRAVGRARAEDPRVARAAPEWLLLAGEGEEEAHTGHRRRPGRRLEVVLVVEDGPPDRRRTGELRLELRAHEARERLARLAEPDVQAIEVALVEDAWIGVGAGVLAEEHHVGGRTREVSRAVVGAAERAQGRVRAHVARSRLASGAGDVARAEV